MLTLIYGCRQLHELALAMSQEPTQDYRCMNWLCRRYLHRITGVRLHADPGGWMDALSLFLEMNRRTNLQVQVKLCYRIGDRFPFLTGFPIGNIFYSTTDLLKFLVLLPPQQSVRRIPHYFLPIPGAQVSRSEDYVDEAP